MKRKLDPVKKEHRMAWRLAAFAATKPATVTVRHTDTPKALRAHRTAFKDSRGSVEPGTQSTVDLRSFVANLFKGITYKGPYVHVTHRDAFLNRQTKRLERERAKYADGTPIVTELGEKA